MRSFAQFLMLQEASWHPFQGQPPVQPVITGRRKLYHVTTNLTGVLASGGLKSRAQLGTQRGLGGHEYDQDTVSTTYSWDYAERLYEQMHIVTRVVSGQMKASDVYQYLRNLFRASGKDSVAFFTHTIDEQDWILDTSVGKYLTEILGEDGALALSRTNDSTPLNRRFHGPAKTYEFFKTLESYAMDDHDDHVYEDDDDDGIQLSAGFDAPFSAIQHIKPSEIAILQLAVRKNARTVHQEYGEAELRFKPADVHVVQWTQPPPPPLG